MARRSKSISETDNLREFLKAHGLRATAQRLAVHDAMLALGHASADQVADHILAAGDKPITVSSVYNILSHFTSLGLYAIRPTTGSKMVFDINTKDHIHLYDTREDTLKDISDDAFIEVVNAYARKHRIPGYKLDYVDIQLVCHPTRRKKKI